MSLATTKLVHLFGAVSVVTPVILIVAVAPDTVPSPCVTAEFSIFPVVKPYLAVLSSPIPPGPRTYISLTAVLSDALNVKSVFSPV